MSSRRDVIVVEQACACACATRTRPAQVSSNGCLPDVRASALLLGLCSALIPWTGWGLRRVWPRAIAFISDGRLVELSPNGVGARCTSPRRSRRRPSSPQPGILTRRREFCPSRSMPQSATGARGARIRRATRCSVGTSRRGPTERPFDEPPLEGQKPRTRRSV